MPNRGWTMRFAVPGDLAEIRELHELVFDRPAAMDEHVWKFCDNPGGPGVAMLAIDGGRIVGQYALMPVRMRLGSEIVLGAQSLDTMVHPDYRGQGMFTRLAIACFELAASRGTEVLYGFPNENSYPGFVRSLNWDHTGDIPRFVRWIDLGGHPRVPVPVRPLANAALKLLRSGNPSAGDSEVRLGAPTADALDGLIAVWRQAKGLCRVERSGEWYGWRFSSRSQRQYEWVTAYRQGEARACVIWWRDGGGSGYIAEYLGCDPAALEAATATILRRARSAGVRRLVSATNVESAISALSECGFMRRGGVPLIVRSLTARNLGGNIHDHAAWSVSPADMDTF